MSRLVIALSAGILAVVLMSGTAFVTLPAAAAPAADAAKAAAKGRHRQMPGAGQGAGALRGDVALCTA